MLTKVSVIVKQSFIFIKLAFLRCQKGKCPCDIYFFRETVLNRVIWRWAIITKPMFSTFYTTQVASAFCARWMANSEVNSKYFSPPSSRGNINSASRVSIPTIFRYIERHKLFLGICVIYTKTIKTWVSVKEVNIHNFLPC